jgi:hypothetical protein
MTAGIITLLALISIPIVFWAWKKADLNWLNWISLLIIFSLPFERIPSLEVMGITLRFSQVFTLIGVGIFIILFFKKQFLNFKWSKINYWLIALLVATTPSLFNVTNWNRYFITTIATLIVFCAAFLIANFLKNRITAILGLIVSFTVVSLFGYFQFFADLLGAPISITLLKQTYTKAVFGFPRVHSTAQEPLYFAGMLFLPIFVCLIIYLNPKLNLKLSKQIIGHVGTIKNKFFSEILKFIISNLSLILLLLFVGLFTITIAKGAWFAIMLVLPFFVLGTWNQLNFKKLFFQIVVLICLIFPLAILFSFTSPSFQNSLNKVTENFSETILGTSSTFTERDNFQSLAFDLLKPEAIIGVGSGQYGILAERPLRSLKTDANQYFIVNNVYLEIWLEQGIAFLIIFIGMLVWLISTGITKLKNLNSFNLIQSIHLSIILAVICNLIQWFTFSPIYIMPIFILLGLLANYNQYDEQQ